jgi:hypothetical protein
MTASHKSAVAARRKVLRGVVVDGYLALRAIDPADQVMSQDWKTIAASLIRLSKAVDRQIAMRGPGRQPHPLGPMGVAVAEARAGRDHQIVASSYNGQVTALCWLKIQIDSIVVAGEGSRTDPRRLRALIELLRYVDNALQVWRPA